MEKLKNLEQLNAQAKKILTPYLHKLLNLNQENVISIFVCGHLAARDYVHKLSNINLFVILDKLEFYDLSKNLKLVSGGIKQKISAPLFLTREHIKTSTDVFPIEFLEMKENHLLLYGQDLLSALQIAPANIRLFCEEQIKGKLIRIRQAYLEIGLKRKGIEALLKESLSSLTPVFRSLIRLKEKTPLTERAGIYKQLADEFNLDSDVFLSILRDTSNDEKIASQDVEVFLEKYLAQLQKLATSVDQL